MADAPDVDFFVFVTIRLTSGALEVVMRQSEAQRLTDRFNAWDGHLGVKDTFTVEGDQRVRKKSTLVVHFAAVKTIMIHQQNHDS